MFHADVFGRDHFAVEHHLLASVFLVIPFDQPEYLLYESRIARVVVDLDAERFGGLYQSVHADGQVLAVHVDVACVEQRQHPFVVKILEVFVIGHLHLVYQVHHPFEEREVRQAGVGRMLDTAVEVDRQHAFRSGRNATGAERIAETVVLNLVSQAAAAAQRVGVVAHVGEERMSFRIHSGGDVSVFFVQYVAVFRQQRHRLDREGEHGFGALGVEPPHETLLEPVERIPVGFVPVRENEIAEQAFEIVFVVIGDVPEDRLEIACAGGLVDRVDDLFETVGDYLVERTLFFREVDHLVGPQEIVVSVLLPDEVVQVH